MNDILVNKVQSIQRCAERASEEYRLAGNDFPTDYTRQDAAVLNITRACEQAIDLANHLIRTHKIGYTGQQCGQFCATRHETRHSHQFGREDEEYGGFS